MGDYCINEKPHVFVLSAGPSLDPEKIKPKRKDYVIAINSAALIFPDAHAICMGDYSMIEIFCAKHTQRPPVWTLSDRVARTRVLYGFSDRVREWKNIPFIPAPVSFSFSAALWIAAHVSAQINAGIIAVHGHDCTDMADCAGDTDSVRDERRWERENREVMECLVRNKTLPWRFHGLWQPAQERMAI